MGVPIHDLSVEETFVATAAQTSFHLPCRLFPGYEDAFEVTKNDIPCAYNAAPSTTLQFKTVATGDEGVDIIFGAGLTAGDDVYIRRQLPVERITQFPETGPVNMADVNADLNRIVALIQDLGMARDEIEAFVTELLDVALADKQDKHANLTALAGLSLAGAAALVIKVNGTENGFVLSADLTGGGGGGGGSLADGNYGGVTVSGVGTVINVNNGHITLARMANVNTSTVFYRKTGGAGAPEVQTLATLKTDLGLTGTNTGDQFTAMTSARLLGRYTAGFGAAQEIALGSSLNFNTGAGTLHVTFASAAEIRTGTEAAKSIAPDQLVASAAFQALADGANISWNMASGYNAKVTLGGARTLNAPTNPKEGLTYTLMVIQDATGGRTLSWPASISFGSAGAPTLSTVGGKKDLVHLQCIDAAAPEFRATFNKSA